MERNVQRIDGLKMDLGAMETGELESVRDHLLGRHAVITAGVELIESELRSRLEPRLPFDTDPRADELPEEMMGDRPELPNGASMDPRWDAYVEATRDV